MDRTRSRSSRRAGRRAPARPRPASTSPTRSRAPSFSCPRASCGRSPATSWSAPSYAGSSGWCGPAGAASRRSGCRPTWVARSTTSRARSTWPAERAFSVSTRHTHGARRSTYGGGAGRSACTARCCSARTDLAPADGVPLWPQLDLAGQIAVLIAADEQVAQQRPSGWAHQVDDHEVMPDRVEVVQGGHPARLLAACVIAVKLAHAIQVAAVVDLDAQGAPTEVRAEGDPRQDVLAAVT